MALMGFAGQQSAASFSWWHAAPASAQMLPATSGARLLADRATRTISLCWAYSLSYPEHTLCLPGGLVGKPNEQTHSLASMPVAHRQFCRSPDTDGVVRSAVC